MQDYLLKFVTDDGFDIGRLLDEDFLRAIKLCWNDRRYTSAAKLLMSMLDSLAYLEYGDVPRNFQKWLDSYCELQPLGITSEELWEFRNSMLHMTNTRSRRVIAGQVAPLVIYVGHVDPRKLPTPDGVKPLAMWQLILSLESAVTKWVESFNVQRDKFGVFIERYDQVISDARYLRFEIPPEWPDADTSDGR